MKIRKIEKEEKDNSAFARSHEMPGRGFVWKYDVPDHIKPRFKVGDYLKFSEEELRITQVYYFCGEVYYAVCFKARREKGKWHCGSVLGALLESLVLDVTPKEKDFSPNRKVFWKHEYEEGKTDAEESVDDDSAEDADENIVVRIVPEEEED